MLPSNRPRFPDLLLLVLLGLSLVGVGIAGHRQKSSVGQPVVLPLPAEDSLQEGDIVLRRGIGIISETLRQFSRTDPSYSHAGMLVRINGDWNVLHAIGGEDNPSDRMLAEPLKVFCRSDYSCSIGIVRLKLSKIERGKLIRSAKAIYHSAPYFDSDFDLASDDRLYCTEFVYKAVSQATGDKKFLPLTTISGHAYVACDNLYLNPHARFVYSYVSNRNQ